MMDPIRDMLHAIDDPSTRHAAFVHLPVALALVGIPLAVVAVAAGRRVLLRCIAVAVYVTLAGTAWLAAQSGSDAHAEWTAQMPAAVYETVDTHQDLAGWVWPMDSPRRLSWCWVLCASVLCAVSTVLTLLLCLTIAAWVAYTAHLGGKMVYEFGAGTPQPLLAQAEVAAPLEPGETSGPERDARAAFFAAEVLPILEQNCMRCHNPGKQRAGLDQTTIAGIFKGGVSGPAVIPGQPDESLLIQAARHDIEDLKMPPDADKLPDTDLAKLVQWVRDGAVWSCTAVPKPAP